MSTSVQSITSTNQSIIESPARKQLPAGKQLTDLPAVLFKGYILEFLCLRDHISTRLVARQFLPLFPFNAYLGPGCYPSADNHIQYTAVSLSTILDQYKINGSLIRSIGAPISPIIVYICREKLFSCPLKILEIKMPGICKENEPDSFFLLDYFINEGLEKLASSQVRLEYLVLQYTNVNDKGLELLKKMPLNTLIIRNNIKGKITDQSILTLSKIPSLTHLEIHCSSITQKGLLLLAKLPLKKLCITRSEIEINYKEWQKMNHMMLLFKGIPHLDLY